MEENESPKSMNGVSKSNNENSADELDDLFGGAGSDEERERVGSDDLTPIASPIASPIISDDEEEEPANLDDEERRLNFESESMSNVFRLPLKSWNNKYIVAKVPNFFHYTTAAFRPDNYNPAEDQAVEDAIKLGAQDGLRWRYKKNNAGEETNEKESNARIIKWSDGTKTLLIGKEQFEISSESLESKHQFLTVPHRGSNTLELHEKLTEHITFCPITGSTTHKKLTIAIQSRHAKQVKTQFVDMNKDPKLIQLQIEAERDKKHNVQKRIANTNRVPKGRRKHDDDSDAEERNSTFGISKPRNDSYEDDSGFVVADEDEDDDFDKLKRRRKGKEKMIIDNFRKKTTPSATSSKSKKHRFYDDESNEDDQDDSFQVDDEPSYEYRDRHERPKKRVKEHHYIEETLRSRRNNSFEESDEENQVKSQERDEHSKKRVKEQQRIVEDDDGEEVNVVDQIASEPDEDEEEMPVVVKRRKRNRNVVVTDDDD
ncbi:Leo1-like protein [Gigaspora rosea]|uniref:Leo1-like protein n=1 Tax=Gigaspora rosea TaxID=44941 RepID=A0A397U4T8_9GLOM|nr:Leo1-like protein [Gigaspora rosea]